MNNSHAPSEAGETSTQFRHLKGLAKTLTRVALLLSILIPVVYVLRINTYLGFIIYPQQIAAIFLGFMLALSFILVPARHTAKSYNKIPWYDLVLAFLIVPPSIYIAVFYPSIVTRVIAPPLFETIFGIVTVILVLEAIRRHMGWSIVLIVAFFIFHTLFSNIFPGFLYGKGYNWSGVVELYYTFGDGIYGLVLIVMSTIIVPFMLFGDLIACRGGDNVLMNAVMSILGQFRGGPAKAAVVGSCAFGSISGSPVANVMVTGSVTIPLMKKTGYKPHFAGAVEAVASSGGQIMPPVMGAIAFLIAQYLNVSYGAVIIAALLPALLYYISLFFQVDLEAGKLGMKGLPRASLPLIWPSIKASWWILPPFILLLLFLLLFNFPTDLSGIYAVGSVILIRFFWKQGRLNFRDISSAIEGTARIMLAIGAIGAAAGIIIGSISMSGLGVNMSLGLLDISGGNLFVLLVLTAVICIIMGMGMPVVTCYIMLVVLIAPALQDAGIIPMAAHMFIFYYAVFSFITPPVAPAAYAAAGIAKTSMWKVGWTAMRLAIVPYFIAFAFVYDPLLLMKGPPFEIAIAFVAAIIGAFLLAVANTGFLFKPVSSLLRVILGLSGLALLFPHALIQGVGAIVGILYFFWELKKAKKV